LNASSPPPIVAAQPADECLPPTSRREQLRSELLTTVDLLYQRRADLITDGFIEDYVAFDWLEWNGGALRLTAVGKNMCQQMRDRLP
jgi:hypothetical protein